jgi:hypothetical protein
MEDLLKEAQAEYAAGNLTKEEYVEILKDIQNLEKISEDADYMEMQGKVLMTISGILSAL